MPLSNAPLSYHAPSYAPLSFHPPTNPLVTMHPYALEPAWRSYHGIVGAVCGGLDDVEAPRDQAFELPAHPWFGTYTFTSVCVEVGTPEDAALIKG